MLVTVQKTQTTVFILPMAATESTRSGDNLVPLHFH
jgi:hypothetical protein